LPLSPSPINLIRIYPILLLLFVVAACRPAKIVSSDADSYAMKNDTVGIDSSIYKMILPYKTYVDKAMDVTLAFAANEMPAPNRKNIATETLLGNFLADVFMKYTNEFYKPADGQTVDFALFNTGGIRNSLPKGAITIRNVFEVLPFDNRLTVVTMSGDSVQALFNYVAKKGGDPVSGLQLGISNGKPVNPIIQGKPFDKTKTYKVLTNDFCAMGGDYMGFFTGAKNYEDVGAVLRDAIIHKLKEYNAQGLEIEGKLDQRIYNADAK